MSMLKYLKPAFLLVSKRNRSSRLAMSVPHDNEEKGFPPNNTTTTTSTDNNNAAADGGHDHHRASPQFPLVCTTDPLASFRNLVGIQTPQELAERSILNRPAKNLGIYGRVVAAERHANRDYHFWATLINSCLGLQIVVAATLTALGAAGGTHGAAVTAFGAINTVIAGFLTYLKGSGLPNRIKYYKNEWTKLREYIEQRERDFSVEGSRLVLGTEVKIIENMFEVVMAGIETNTPDSYVNVSQLRKSTGVSPGPPIGSAPVGGIASKKRGEGEIRETEKTKEDTVHDTHEKVG